MDVLVLDMSYVPVARISWRRAVTKLLKGTAELIEEYDDKYVRCDQFTWKMPSIIKILRQVAGVFRRGVKFNRKNIFYRDHEKCQYCGCKITMDGFTFEHVTPKDQGGKTDWDNIVAACHACNQKKRNRTPVQAGMRLLSKPVKPSFVPGSLATIIRSSSDIPRSWRDYLMSIGYWTVDLETG
ncbi:MAG: HNH endonuclease [Bacteroidota bacterium]|jgi:5-methylcytosine-specific restriction endonuclease McrA